jgi:uncharacterized protein DUF3306
MSEEKEAFLDRWSRLKRERPEDEKPAVPEAKQEVAAPLPPVEDLKPDSDCSPFMDPRVADQTRRSALKKLFSDAHFNEPDAFEPYSLDLTVAESIPEEMLKTLNQAKRLLFDEKEQAAQAAADTQAPQPQAPDAELKDVAGKQDA